MNKASPFHVNLDLLPDSSFIRPNDCAKIMGISAATFWRIVARNELTTHKLTARTTSVKAGDLKAYIAGKQG